MALKDLRRSYADELNMRRAQVRRSARWGRSRLRRIRLGWPLAIALGSVALPAVGQTLPQGGTIVAGSAIIQHESSSLLIVQQSTQTLSVNWNSFSVGAGSVVRFLQPGSDSIALNRVLGPDPSQIFGQIQANGRVVITNPNGIYFGPNSRVDVSALVATTANIRTEDFMAGRLNFGLSSSSADARVVNEGLISIAQGGFAVLAAPGVQNAGRIVANGGTVVLAGTKTFAIDFHGDGLLKFAATSLVEQAPAGAALLIENSGVIEAVGGRVTMTAHAARSVLDNVINTTGIVVATSAQMVNGEIVIHGGSSGTVNVSGTLDASGKGSGQSGGTVKVLGEKVALLADSRMDVSGDARGGTVLVGGNYQGLGPEPNAKTVYMDARAVIEASAVTGGNGGKVVLWADDTARVSGQINARGGAAGGDGGMIEASGKSHISFGDAFRIDTLAPFGKAGSLLIDPSDFTIANSGGDMTPGVLASLLNSADVTIQSASGAGGSTGKIDLIDNLSVSAGAAPRTLTLNAVGGIDIHGSVSSNGNLMNFQLNSGANTRILGNIQLYGGYFATNFTGGIGNSTGSFTNSGSIDAGQGNITLNHTGNVNFHGPIISSGIITINSIGHVSQNINGPITGSPSLLVGGTGTVTLTHASNNFSSISMNRIGTTADVSLVTIASPTIGASTLGTGNYSFAGVGFAQSGSIVQDSGAAGDVTINGGAGNVTLSSTNSFSGSLSVSGNSIFLRAPQTFNNLIAKSATYTATGTIELDGTNSSPNFYTGEIFASGAGPLAIALSAGKVVSVKGYITSNGGDVAVWGNAPGGNPSMGLAASGNQDGVMIGSGGVINAGGGNIAIAGRGGNNYGNWGVRLNSGTVVTSGSGAISLTGLGDTSGPGSLIGFGMTSSAVVQAQEGNITISGTGGDGAAVGYNSGVFVFNSSITASGNSSIAITGLGGANANSESIYLANAQIVSAGAGSIAITAPTPAGGGLGLNLLNNLVGIGSSSFLGDLTIAASSVLSTATTLSLSRQPGGGTITLKPTIDSAGIGINSGTGALAIGANVIGAVSGFGTLQIGSASQTGHIDVGSTTFGQNLKIWTKGSASSADISLGSNSLVVVADAGYVQVAGAITTTGTVAFGGGGDVTATNSSNSIGILQLDKTGTSSSVSVVSSGALTLGASTMGTGNLSLSGAGIVQAGSLAQDNFGGYVFLNGGAGTLALSQANVFTGDLFATAGAINISRAQSFAKVGSQAASLAASNGNVFVQAGLEKFYAGNLTVSVDALVGNAFVQTSSGNSIDIGASNVAGSLSIMSGGTLTQSGSITSGSANLSASGTITLSDAMNNFGSTLVLSGTSGTIFGTVGSVSASSGTFIVNGKAYGGSPVATANTSLVVTPDQQVSIVNTTTATNVFGTSTTAATLAPPLVELRGDDSSLVSADSLANEEQGSLAVGSLPAITGGQAVQERGQPTDSTPLAPTSNGTLSLPRIYLSDVPSTVSTESEFRANPAPLVAPVTLVPGLLVLNPLSLPASTVNGGIPGVNSAFPQNGNQALW